MKATTTTVESKTIRRASKFLQRTEQAVTIDTGRCQHQAKPLYSWAMCQYSGAAERFGIFWPVDMSGGTGIKSIACNSPLHTKGSKKGSPCNILAEVVVKQITQTQQQSAHVESYLIYHSS